MLCKYLFLEDVTERLAAKADEMHLRPEDVVALIIETVFGPSRSEIDREIDHDPELRASLEVASQPPRITGTKVFTWTA